MIIRPAQIDDERKIAILIAEFRVELRKLKGIETTANENEAVEEFRGYLNSRYKTFIAQDDNEELIGYMVLKIEDIVVWVESLFVCSNARRNGIASKLYDKAEEIAESLGGDTLYNWVHPNNHRIIPFLAKRGYDVLNLVEVRKKRRGETAKEVVNVGEYKFKY
ncbi:GNAT family N-acetyltransferase [Clostridium oryzae]|uniref:Acetyltransferase (GNAT) family protein n=1 Tax=Clostridium oryzae TaxID=1450648 RepID=A0A1V4ISR8_9CLOT|nr:GNAT family N-acetyltransferase [Clostridium oryzae]OPJ62860.1 acetyltransferase (GNAT) family protein [Clostridium oryzae]